MKTRATEMFGIEHPIFSAGMARVAQAPLVAAVSEAGGMGCLGGVSFLPEALRAEIERIRATTSKPFAVNLLLPDSLTSDDDDQWRPVRELWAQLDPTDRGKMAGVEPLLTPGAVRGQVEVVLDAAPALVVLTFAAPGDFIEECHRRGIKVAALVGSTGRAIAAEQAGVDLLIAQGTEGGGHTGYTGTLPLIPAVVDRVSLPVLAAGGIVDGRGLAAARALGADGVWVGTRFIASPEAFGHEAFKQRVVQGESRELTLTRAYTGKPLRAFRNRWTSQWEESATQPAAFPGQYAVAGMRVETGYQDGDLEWGMMPAGQGISSVYELTPAGDIVRGMAAQADEILSSLA
ncbi:NAD(P)H-dependent flavin oxidoreductase [Microbacterium sp.]|uniref:NAD(P)H-dependent flavin oxidoreductase n=1 Tax=Microbacterium sp. TaxID=51671 RepID=UPI002810A45D|nr:nitronate monooxygenase [Microbacterium sp.]